MAPLLDTEKQVQSKPRMTEAQAFATHPALTAWVGASAGTGKTHVLTARVLRLMLTGTRPANIVCLTFTKAAAAEMKNRIFAELGRWALMPDDELIAEINRRTEERPDEDMLTRARALFAEVLDLSPGLQIQTFHSFCQSLLGRFPLEAGMAPGFEGVDESEARELLSGARDQMLASTRKPVNKQLADALSVVAQLVTESTFDEVIDRLLFEAPMIRRAVNAYTEAGLTAALYRALGLVPGQNDQQVRMAALADTAFDSVGVRELAVALLAGSASDAGRGKQLADFTAATEEDRLTRFDVYMAVFLTQGNTPRKTVATKKILTANPEFADIIEKEQSRLVRVVETLLRLKAAYATACLLQLGLGLLKRYEQQKQERGLVDFEDMIQNTRLLFQQPENAAWVLFKLDAAIDHILVDEAQDTNRDQWQVVESLTDEFFAGQGTRETNRTVFAVGDAKQSIFSFQRADPAEFVAARDRVFEKAREAGEHAEAVPLSLSFRSGEAVLALVDAVFRKGAAASFGVAAADEAVRHDFIREGQAGLVELWPLEVPENKATEGTPEWALPLVQESVDDAEDRTAWRLARRVQAMIMGGEQLPSKGRAIRAGDILVLVRRRTTFVDHLVRAFKTIGIPVAGRDRMVLTDELAVMDLLALAHFSLLPSDDLTLATVLKGPFVGLDDEALFTLSHGRKGSVWQALLRRKNEPKFAAAAAFLSDMASSVDLKTPFEFFSHLLVDLGGRKKLVSRLGDEIHDPVDELLEEALRFELTGAAAMQAFLHSVQAGNLQIKRDLEAAGNYVRIMTVHSAKGLQAPIVILSSDLAALPKADRENRILPIGTDVPGAPPVPLWTSPGKGLSFIDDLKQGVKERQLAEYRRLLYVALTRAEDRLYIAGWRGKTEPDDNSWYTAIREGFEALGSETVDFGPDGKGGRREGLRFEVQQSSTPVMDDKQKAVEQTEEVPGWLLRQMPEEPVPPRPVAPSRPAEEPAVTSPLVRTDKKRFQRGLHIHGLLERLPDLQMENREAAALRYLAKRAPALLDNERLALWQEVKALLDDPAFSSIFGADSRAEVPVAGIISGIAISGQVDRLVVTDTEVLIVDYKTNRPPPQDVTGVAGVYLRQMGLYVRALEGVYPQLTVRAALLWTDVARLMELPKDLMEKALTDSGL